MSNWVLSIGSKDGQKRIDIMQILKLKLIVTLSTSSKLLCT